MKQLFKNTPSEPVMIILLFLLLIITGNLLADAHNKQIIKKENFYSIMGMEHISSIQDGKPFNNRIETNADILWMGIRYKHNAWHIDVAIASEVNSMFAGSNPHAMFRIEREAKLFN
ncbi:hypothetical protein N9C44_00805 [bacterium]|nr:hypothetical protein [bacterium]